MVYQLAVLCCPVGWGWRLAGKNPTFWDAKGNSPENFQGGCGVGAIDFPESQLGQLMDLLVRSCEIVMGCCLLNAKRIASKWAGAWGNSLAGLRNVVKLQSAQVTLDGCYGGHCHKKPPTLQEQNQDNKGAHQNQEEAPPVTSQTLYWQGLTSQLS